MSTDTTPDTASPPESPTGGDWRGVAAEHRDDIGQSGNRFLRKRSRALLADLLRPYARFVVLLIVDMTRRIRRVRYRGEAAERAASGERREPPVR